MGTENRICKNCNLQFHIMPKDFEFYLKIDVPAPTFCPDCRYERRIANRNEWNFYKRNCSLCSKAMVSIYNPLYPGPVYCQPCFWSDAWDPLDYGRDINFSKTFFEQFYAHRFKMPRITLANSKSVNSEYSNQSEENKNCYMMVATGKSENCMYGNWNQSSKDCIDCWAIQECELMYESLNCRKCYNCLFVEDCFDTKDSCFSRDLRGSTHCFGCVGLRNKSYFWFNEQVGKEKYEQLLAKFNWTDNGISLSKKRLSTLSHTLPVKYFHGSNNTNSSGDYIGDNKNVRFAFNCRNSENLKYSQDAWEARDSMDMTETLDNELDYEMEGAGWGSHCIAASKSWFNHNALYSELNFNCNDIFGCVALRKKSYCIFNKQYSKNEYGLLKNKLIEHMKTTNEWGEFFPASISPFPYNDSLAQDYFPKNKATVERLGLKWYDRDERDYKITLNHNDLPESITPVRDSILSEIISCSTTDSEDEKQSHLRCTTAFRLHPAELEFYRRMNLPIPHKCFPCRLQDRLNKRNPRQLWSRQCTCDSIKSVYKNLTTHTHGDLACRVNFETSYAPDHPELVYCEACYQNEIS